MAKKSAKEKLIAQKRLAHEARMRKQKKDSDKRKRLKAHNARILEAKQKKAKAQKEKKQKSKQQSKFTIVTVAEKAAASKSKKKRNASKKKKTVTTKQISTKKNIKVTKINGEIVSTNPSPIEQQVIKLVNISRKVPGETESQKIVRLANMKKQLAKLNKVKEHVKNQNRAIDKKNKRLSQLKSGKKSPKRRKMNGSTNGPKYTKDGRRIITIVKAH